MRQPFPPFEGTLSSYGSGSIVLLWGRVVRIAGDRGSGNCMIKAISFDLYNTLVRFWPPLDEIQQAACRELGLGVSKPNINRGYAVADVFFNQENAARPLSLRSDKERSDFFARYEQIILENAGVPVTLELARQVWDMAISVPKDFVPFEDTVPALASLKEQGYRLGVLSNLRRDINQICLQLGLDRYLDFWVTPIEAGAEKPDKSMFLSVLDQTKVEANETVHIGDQYRADVLGARAVGMHGVLMDRGGWLKDVTDCPKIASLMELEPLLAGAPQSLSTNHQEP